MRWFKHMTQSHSDKKLDKIIDLHGLEIYGFWWMLLEKVAHQIEKDNQPLCKLSLKSWSNFFRISPQRCRTFFEVLDKFSLISLKVFGNNWYEVEVHNLIKFRDEYSRKQSQKLRTKSGVTPDTSRARVTEVQSTEVQSTEVQSTEVQNTDKADKALNTLSKDISNSKQYNCESDSLKVISIPPGNPNKPTDNPDPFMDAYAKKLEQAGELYDLYPKHVGRGSAEAAIMKALDKENFETLREAVVEYAESAYVRTIDRHFIPKPENWFKDERWKDDRSIWAQERSDGVVRPQERTLERYSEDPDEKLRKLRRITNINWPDQSEAERKKQKEASQC